MLEVKYPDTHPIAKLRRTIIPDQHSPKIDFVLEVFPRETVSMPIGLHPTFKLTDTKTTHLVPGLSLNSTRLKIVIIHSI